MIRSYYPLPAVEKDCNAILVLRWGGSGDTLFTEVQGGTATVDATGLVAECTFIIDNDVRPVSTMVTDPAHFLTWFATYEKNPADNPVQQLLSGLLRYSWLQRKGLL